MSFSIAWGELAALIGTLLFGIANVVYRSQREEIDATSINALKIWESVPFLVLLVIVLGIVGEINEFSLRILILLGVSVILGLIFGDLLYLKGQELAGVSRAFPIAMTFPLITYLLEIAFLEETFLFSKGLAIFVIVSGVALIGSSAAESDNQSSVTPQAPISHELGLGILLAILAAFLWATGALVLREGVEDVDPIVAALVRIAFASILMAPMVGITYQKKNWEIPASKSIVLVLIAGFFGMTIGSTLYVIAIKLSGASTTAAITATAPVISIPLSAVFLKEKITPLIIVGTFLTVIGVLLLVL
ncbi:MAG: DMT family transporter [Candidatus Heimdallarchaeota archaeon]